MLHPFRYIALDLDGTLTNEQKQITPRTKAALMRAQQDGVRLILASGRPPYGMRPLATELEMERYGGLLLCYNGGHIEECGTGKVLHEISLDESLLPALLDFQEQSGMTLMTYHEHSIYTMHPDDPYVAISSRNNKMDIVGVNDFIHDVPRPLNKCLMVGNPDIVPEWEQRMSLAMNRKMHICRSTPYFIELLPSNIDKGPALRSLLEQLGASCKELMAFGDSYNDITMLQCAAVGVAMQNADDEVKKHADLITLSNEEDDVAYAIEKVLYF